MSTAVGEVSEQMANIHAIVGDVKAGLFMLVRARLRQNGVALEVAAVERQASMLQRNGHDLDDCLSALVGILLPGAESVSSDPAVLAA